MNRFYLFSIFLVLFQFASSVVLSQRRAIVGNIVNSETGGKISNANIFESLTGIGTISNSSGYFRLMLNEGAVELSISIDGYKPLKKEFALQSDTVMEIGLNPVKELNLTAGHHEGSNNREKAQDSANIQKIRQK